MNIELYLPFPPSTNNYYVKTQRGVFISQKGRLFRDQAAEAVRSQLGAQFQAIDVPVMIEVVWYPPDNRRRDQDNFIGKAFFDALTKSGIWEDDCQVVQSFVYKGQVDKPNGSVWLRISEGGPLFPLGSTPSLEG